jgi:hypothetical protein
MPAMAGSCLIQYGNIPVLIEVREAGELTR